MKKVLLLILSFVLCLSAAACSDTKPEEGDQPRKGYTLWQSGRETGASAEERKTESYELQAGTAEEFTVANYYSDDMIVPRDREIVVWGTAPESQNGKIISAEFKGLKGSAVIENGAWKLVLQGTLPASCELGHTLTVSGAEGVQKEFEDVLVGDIWVVSGQSNSDLTFQGTVAGSGAAIQKLYKTELSNAVKEDPIRLLRQSNLSLMNTKYKEAMRTPQTDILKGYRWSTAEKKRVVGSAAITSFSMMGYFFAKELSTLNPDVPVGMIMAGCGGAPLSLLVSPEANEAFPATLQDGTLSLGGVVIPTCGIYNMFIAPLTNVGITGMIFYQGESDTNYAEDYGDALKIFVEDLRGKFGTNFLFINTQLTSYGYESGGAQLVGIWDKIMDLRFAQSEVKIDNSISDYEVLSTLDIGWKEGDLDGAHPYYKKEIGQRAAAIAAAKLYHIGDAEQVGCPVPAKIEYNNKSVEITFDYAGGGLKAQSGDVIKGFEVKAGGVWKAAEVSVADGNRIVIKNVSDPQGVRYAPENRYSSTENANLCSGTGYPAAAFSAEFS